MPRSPQLPFFARAARASGGLRLAAALAPSAALALALVGVFAVIIVEGARRQDAALAAETSRRVDAAVAAVIADAAADHRALAAWSGAVDAIALRGDVIWAETHFRPRVAEIAMIFDPAGRPLFAAADDGVAARAQLDALSPELRDWVAGGIAGAGDDFDQISETLALAPGGAVASAALSRLRGSDGEKPRLAPVRWVLTVDIWDQATFRRIERLAGLDIAHVDAVEPLLAAQAREGEAVLPLSDASGRPIARVAWPMRAPAQAALERNLPWLAALAAALLCAALTLAARALAFARERERLGRAAELASASRSAFVTNVTHELRTPVNAIQGMTSLLRETALDPRQTRCVEAMDAACAQLLTLVGDVIDFARIEDGKIEVASAPFDTASVASQAVEVVRGAAERKGLTVALSLAPEAMGPRLGDAELTRQVLVNLLGNAVKYTEEGRVGLSVSPAPGGALRFEISDTGPGLTDAEIARIFTRFSQGDAGRVAGGSGLGLEIAKSLVERMGGRIGARALPKVGSMFWVELPAPRAAAAADSDSDSDAAAPPAPAPREAMRWAARSDEVFTLSESLMLTPPKPAAAEPPAPAGAEPAAPDAAENLPAEDSPAADSPALDSPAAANADAVNAARAKAADAGDGDHDAGGRPRALLAEDNALNRMLVVQALEALDLEIIEVGNGRDAVDAAASRRFDLILMDIEMPVLSGVEAIKVIRALPPGHGDAPILALTAHASGRDGNFYGAIGATATLPKPLDLGALRETVRGLARL